MLAIEYYNYKMFYKSLTVITEHKPIKDMQKIKIKESKHTITENYHTPKEEGKRGRKEQMNYKTINKMAIVSPYPSISTLM